MSAPVCSECGLCRLEGPDPFGNYTLHESDTCPVHGRSGETPTAIPLWRKGSVIAYAIVDPEDYERLGGFHWTCDKDNYGVRAVQRDGRQVMLRLHREILGLPPGDPRTGDHRNCNTLDCRRDNLRILAPGLNQQNRRGPDRRANRTSRHRGVSWNRAKAKWKATVGRRYLGYFDSETEAARVASEYRRIHMPASEMDRV